MRDACCQVCEKCHLLHTIFSNTRYCITVYYSQQASVWKVSPTAHDFLKYSLLYYSILQLAGKCVKSVTYCTRFSQILATVLQYITVSRQVCEKCHLLHTIFSNTRYCITVYYSILQYIIVLLLILTVIMMAKTMAPKDRMVWKISSCPIVEQTPKATKCRWISGWLDTKLKNGMSSFWCTSVTKEKIVLKPVIKNIIWTGLRSCSSIHVALWERD